MPINKDHSERGPGAPNQRYIFSIQGVNNTCSEYFAIMLLLFLSQLTECIFQITR